MGTGPSSGERGRDVHVAYAQLVATQTLNASGVASLAISLPPPPALLGLRVYRQAAFPASQRLSGLVTTHILPL